MQSVCIDANDTKCPDGEDTSVGYFIYRLPLLMLSFRGSEVQNSVMRGGEGSKTLQ